MFFFLGVIGYYYLIYIKYIGNNVVDFIKIMLGKIILNKELFFILFEYNSFNYFVKLSGL